MSRVLARSIAAAALFAVACAAPSFAQSTPTPTPATPPAAATPAPEVPAVPAPATPAPAAPASAAAKAVLSPVKNWFAPGKEIQIKIGGEGPVTLAATEFLGGKVEPKGATEVNPGDTVDLLKIFPSFDQAGTYILYAVPKGKELAQFAGTPLVVEVRADRRPQGVPGPQVTKVENLKYVVMTTTKGPITMAWYYDVAPNTVSNFLSLASHGYYDGLIFHRIIANFVIQGGDPRGDGMGGPGYQIQGEFNERLHKEGVLSMARSQSPDSAGSQFFICLDYTRTQQLDRKYTAFGQVTGGMDVVQALGSVKTDPSNDRPIDAVSITKVEVKNVTSSENPYVELVKKLNAK